MVAKFQFIYLYIILLKRDRKWTTFDSNKIKMKQDGEPSVIVLVLYLSLAREALLTVFVYTCTWKPHSQGLIYNKQGKKIWISVMMIECIMQINPCVNVFFFFCARAFFPNWLIVSSSETLVKSELTSKENIYSPLWL